MFADSAGPGAALIALAAVAFVLGGLVKGTLGIGLPLVALPLLSTGWSPTRAMALVVAPVLASNLWQAWDSGISMQGVRRFLPLIVALPLATLVTVPWTLSFDDAVLRRLLAGAVLLAVVLNAMPLRLTVPPKQERWWSAAVGLLSGVLGGVSAMTGPVVITYLMSLRLARDVFVGTISVVYLGSAVALYGSMAVQGRLHGGDLLLSALALLPVALGMAIGKRLRGKLSEQLFRRVLLGALVLLALLLIFRK